MKSNISLCKVLIIIMQSINNQTIDREVPLCLSFINVDTDIIEESGNKFLILALTENNKEVLQLLEKTLE